MLGIPRKILFAEGNRALVRNLGWIGIAASLALALGWVGGSVLIVRPVKALVRASTRLATGDLSTRTGLRHGKDELGQLTRTFDHMAQALQQRELERQLAEDTLQTRDHMMRELPLLPAAVCVCDQLGAVETLQPGRRRVMGMRAARPSRQPALLRRAPVVSPGWNTDAPQRVARPRKSCAPAFRCGTGSW